MTSRPDRPWVSEVRHAAAGLISLYQHDSSRLEQARATAIGAAATLRVLEEGFSRAYVEASLRDPILRAWNRAAITSGNPPDLSTAPPDRVDEVHHLLTLGADLRQRQEEVERHRLTVAGLQSACRAVAAALLHLSRRGLLEHGAGPPGRWIGSRCVRDHILLAGSRAALGQDEDAPTTLEALGWTQVSIWESDMRAVMG